MRLRVLAYNVRGFRHGADRVANVAGHFQPDVVLMNETDGRLALRRFARAMGMRAARDPFAPLRRRVKNAVLARPPWRIATRRLHRFAGSTRFFPRGALVAELERPGARIWAVSVHLGLHPGERRRHAEQLVAVLRTLPGPVIVGGDLNESPDGAAAASLSGRLWDVWLLGGDASGETYPADDPAARIDYLFVSEGVRVERAAVPAGPAARTASDHRPVVAELTLERATSVRAGAGGGRG